MRTAEEIREEIETLEGINETLAWDAGKEQESLDDIRAEIDDLENSIECYTADADDEETWEMFKADQLSTIEDVEVMGITISAENLFEMMCTQDSCAVNEAFSAWADDKERDIHFMFPEQIRMQEDIEEKQLDIETSEERIEEYNEEIETNNEKIDELQEELDALDDIEEEIA